ncbi:MAG: hypothetical protein GY847_30915 [Proteobacteria bacterium]|nr:hypothetical protein [Pseudomonadota bacterium]
MKPKTEKSLDTGNRLPRQTYKLVNYSLFLAFAWGRNLAKELDLGTLEWMGMGLGFSLAILLIDYLLARIGMQYPTRLGVWTSAGFTPLVVQSASEKWESFALRWILGGGSVVLSFIVAYLIVKVFRLCNTTTRTDQEKVDV